MTTYTFPRVTAKRTVSGRCSLCGRRVRRSRTFGMTVNPFNRNPDGTVRTTAEVRAAVNAEALAWAPDFTHAFCAGEPEDGAS